MWWFAALHANLLLLYRRAGGATRGTSLLDAGCGTGGFLAQIAAEFPERSAVGLDAAALACARAAAKSRRPVCAGSVNALPFADAAFGGIFSADVLCHAGVDESAALAQFHRCLGDNGVLVLSLPAYRWMMSRHDLAVSNVRRYTRSGLARLLQAAGFRVIFAGYWNMLLFPLMVLTRKLLPDAGAPVSDVKPYSPPVEAVCRAATAVERALLRWGVSLPFGGSVIAVAAKPSANTGSPT
jgi:SAM-dependent methyltransferase